MNQAEVLAEANKLFGNGMRQAAIDLLHEYLESDPDSAKVLRTLGRAYLLSRRPEKAVIYLKRSLEITERSKTPTPERSDYRADDFDDDDMAFVSAEESNAQEKSFSFEDEATQAVTGQWPEPSGELHHGDRTAWKPIPPPNGDEALPAALIQKQRDPNIEHSGDGLVPAKPAEAEPGRLEEPVKIDSHPTAAEKPSLGNDRHSASESENPPVAPVQPEPAPDRVSESQRSIDLQTGSQIDLPYEQDDFDEEDIGDDVSSDSFLADVALDDGNEALEDDDADSDLFFDEAQKAGSESAGDREDELDLDDLEGLDDFDEFASQVVEEPEDKDAISRAQRARQIAVDVLAEADWEPRHLDLLQDIFIEKGWSATRRALEVAIKDGLTPEELSSAREVRQLWEDSDQYWITFHKIKSNAASCQADAAYRHMSWLEAIRLVRSFPEVPGYEEVYDFIEESYDQWYQSKRLRRVFKAFFKFLRYRASLMRHTSRGELVFSRYDPATDDVGIDSDAFGNALAPESQRLQQLGVPRGNWAMPNVNEIQYPRRSVQGGEAKPEMPAAKKMERNRRASFEAPETPVEQSPSFGFGSSVWHGTDHPRHEWEK